MSDRALVTMYEGEHEIFRHLTFGSIAHFAAEHGYVLLEAGSGPLDVYPWWWKIPAMAAALRQFEFATWIDGDVFVVKPRCDPVARLTSPRARGAFIGLAADMRDGAVTSLFVMRAGDRAQRFLAEAWELRYARDYDLGDQGAVQRLIADDRFADGVVSLGYHWMGPECVPVAGTRMIHGCRQTGGSVPQRAWRLQREIERVTGRRMRPSLAVVPR